MWTRCNAQGTFECDERPRHTTNTLALRRGGNSCNRDLARVEREGQTRSEQVSRRADEHAGTEHPEPRPCPCCFPHEALVAPAIPATIRRSAHATAGR